MKNLSETQNDNRFDFLFLQCSKFEHWGNGMQTVSISVVQDFKALHFRFICMFFLYSIRSNLLLLLTLRLIPCCGVVFYFQKGKSSSSSECSPKSYHPESCSQHFGSSPSLNDTHLAKETLISVPAGIISTGSSNPLNLILLHPLRNC